MMMLDGKMLVVVVKKLFLKKNYTKLTMAYLRDLLSISQAKKRALEWLEKTWQT